MKIIVDAFGGDNAPAEIVNASLLALYNHRDLKITLVGKADVIQDNLQGKKYDQARLDIVDAREVISCDESPVEAIRTKRDSSIVRGIELLKEKPDEYSGFISAGSTGAILSAAVLKLGRIKGVVRPALAPLLPTVKGTPVMLVDAGANVDVKPVNLVQFAVLGNTYMQKVMGIKKPRVALLNVGTEEAKGNELVKETYPLLKQLDINFVGNMEGRDLLSGNCDIVVADGFSGNVLLKSTEGACKLLMKEIKKIMLGSIRGKIGALFLKKPLKKLAKQFDYESLGGSVLLGTKGLVVKAHGSSKAKEFLYTIEQLLDVAKTSITKDIETNISQISMERLEEKAKIAGQVSENTKNSLKQDCDVQTEPNTKETESELEKMTEAGPKETSAGEKDE